MKKIIFNEKNNNAALNAATEVRDKARLYSEIFFKRSDVTTRHCAYISEETYNKASEIIRVLARNKITVGGYLDMIIRQHFNVYSGILQELERQETDGYRSFLK